MRDKRLILSLRYMVFLLTVLAIMIAMSFRLGIDSDRILFASANTFVFIVVGSLVMGFFLERKK